jgi:DNA polymerase-3 subunit alpha
MVDRKTPKIPFVNLHAHDVGSINDGFGYVPDHLDFVYENGLDAHALTNHGNMNTMSYQVLHSKKMEKDGRLVKPIYGVEAYFIPSIEEWKKQQAEIQDNKKKKKADGNDEGIFIEDETKRFAKNVLNRRNHLVLLAQNQQGLYDLYKMVSESYNKPNFYRFPRIDFEVLERLGANLIATSACLGGVLAEHYWRKREDGRDAVMADMRDTNARMVEIFGDRWYLELQWNKIPEQHELNQYIIDLSKETGVPLVSTVDCHYPRPEMWKERVMYNRLGWLSQKTAGEPLPASRDELMYELYPKNGDEVWESFLSYAAEAGVKYDEGLVRESIERTHQIAHERIESFYPDTTVRLPDFVVPEGKTADVALADICAERMAERGLDQRDGYQERLEYELDVISTRGFSKYFLTTIAITDRANEMMLMGPGRGSGGGSLVAYVLGITHIDPIKWGLQFERFMTKKGSGYPDIDLDFSHPTELKDALIDEWGDDTVVRITNYGTLQPSSLIKDISKFHDVPFMEVNSVTRKMGFEAKSGIKKERGIDAGFVNPTYDELMRHSPTLVNFFRKYPKVQEHVDKLIGQMRSISVHAGGVLVQENLNEYMPLIRTYGKGTSKRQTPWSEGQNVRHLEPMGFIKFDLLGLKTLLMIDGAIRKILKRQGNKNPTFKDVKAFYNQHLHPDVIDFDDQEVYKDIFHEGRWPGIFQFAEKGMQRFCMNATPHSLIDLTAVTSIYRPGPLNSKIDKKYVRAKNDPSLVEYIHPSVEQMTKESYGFIVWQEQIASVVSELGRDVSLDDGNKFRKVLTKKGLPREVEAEKERIKSQFRLGCADHGISEASADKILNELEFHSKYSFNRSHALAYSAVSFQCAWLAHYYPTEWMAAYLDKEDKKKEKALSVARSSGYEIANVNINDSDLSWTISNTNDNTLVQPLIAVKGMGPAAIEEILEHRPFTCIEDILFGEGVVRRKLNKKALDVLCRCGALDDLIDERFTGRKHFWSACIVDMPKTKKKFLENIEAYKDFGDFTKAEKIEQLTNITGLYPLDMVVDTQAIRHMEKLMVPPLGDMDTSIYEIDPDHAVVWAVPRQVEVKYTKNKRPFYVVHCIDSSYKQTNIRVWGPRPKKDKIYTNRIYLVRPNYDPNWGYSTKGLKGWSLVR